MRTTGAVLTVVLALAGPQAVAEEKVDPLLFNVPKEVRKVCEETFPGYRALSVGERKEKGQTRYRITFFDPADRTIYGRKDGDEAIMELKQYRFEVTADGKVVEEPRHHLREDRVPKAVIDRYKKWLGDTPPRAMVVGWEAEREKDKDRVFHVWYVVNSVTGYSASFKEDGTLLKENKTGKE